MWTLLCLSSNRQLYWLSHVTHEFGTLSAMASLHCFSTSDATMTEEGHRETEEHTEIEGNVPSATTLLFSFDRPSIICLSGQTTHWVSFIWTPGTRSLASLQPTCKIVRWPLYRLASISTVHFQDTYKQITDALSKDLVLPGEWGDMASQKWTCLHQNWPLIATGGLWGLRSPAHWDRMH